jgi:glycosyltransferase involved in cell wall biosynthesis
MKISVLLPTRKRTDALKTCLETLIVNADDPASIEYLLAFDDDDQDTIAWFKKYIAPIIDRAGSTYTAYEFQRMGYTRLNEYLNQLVKFAQGQWILFWNDDAVMNSKGWDTVINSHGNAFRVLRMPTHNNHPYAIFPIVPREWYELFGYLSAHQISDAWISQVAYLVDIMVNVPIDVTHDRHDLTGNNKDDTFKERIMFEGTPTDSRDFNHVSWRQRRLNDAAKISRYLDLKGEDITWFKNVCAGKQNPWEKMLSAENDPNNQVATVKKPPNI